MENIDEVLINKIYNLVNYILINKIKPDMRLDKVSDINEEVITYLKEQYGIKGIILDVDKTIRKNMQKIPKCNQEWIENLKRHLKVIIVSNGLDKNIDNYFKKRGIEYIGLAYKPLRKNFQIACKKLNLEPEEVLVVGDSLFTDIYGGKRNNMKTLHIKSVEEEISI